MVVQSRPVAGREDEYNAWYDDVHLPEVLTVSGFVSAQRYVTASTDGAEPYPYLAVYEIEGDGAQVVAGLFAAGLAESSAIDEDVVVRTYRTIGARQTRVVS